MIYYGKICTLKNLTAATNGKRFGVALVIGLGTVIALHFKAEHSFIADIGSEQNSVTVGIHAAHIFAVYLNDNFSGGF